MIVQAERKPGTEAQRWKRQQIRGTRAVQYGDGAKVRERVVTKMRLAS